MADPLAILTENRALRIELNTLRAELFALRGERIRQSAQNDLIPPGPVMAFFGYRNRPAFWEFVRRHGVPHIRVNARVIRFDPRALNAWLARRDTSGKPRQFTFGPDPNQALPAA
jgi:hypothetical protein